MTTHDLCLAWNWEHDASFVDLLETACRGRARSLLQITPANLERTLGDLVAGRDGARAFLDRASEADPRFLPLVDWARNRALLSINPYEDARRAWDKVAMHEALFAVLRTPYTLVIPPFSEQPSLEPLDLAPLGARFSIKPAHGGGGDGVILEARTLDQVLAARRQYPQDKYLLQQSVRPVAAGRRPAWFRVIHSAGEIYPCWWDIRTHVYTPVTAAEESHYNLLKLRDTMKTIARVCGLGLFSTEIGLADDGLVVVDYVNDPIDLRLQSRSPEGVPDDIARFIAESLANLAASVRI